MFDYNGRLYQIEGTSLSSGNDATADAIRFAQSAIFTGGAPNRSPDEIRAARALVAARACPKSQDFRALQPRTGSAVFERRCRRGTQHRHGF
jgi:hypothetical protein